MKFFKLRLRALPVWGWLAGGVVLVVTVLFVVSRPEAPQARTESHYPEGVTAAEYLAAELSLAQKSTAVPRPVDVYALLADRAAAEANYQKAVACFERIPSNDSHHGHAARLQQGQLLVQLNRVSEAEKALQEFLELEARHPKLGAKARSAARKWLRYLFSVQLRFEERQTLLAQMFDQRELELPWVLIFCFPNYNHWNVSDAVSQIEAFLKADPGNFRMRVALGRYRIAEGRSDEARTILERCHAEKPSDKHAVAALMSCLHEMNETKRFREVMQSLPPLADNEPWLLMAMRGHGHSRLRQFDRAADCFRKLISSMPTNAEAHIGLAGSLIGGEKQSSRTAILNKAKVIARIQARMGSLTQDPSDHAALIEIAELCESIDLIQQGTIVAELANQIEPANSRAKQVLTRLTKEHEQRRTP